jgi:hypothetical protein
METTMAEPVGILLAPHLTITSGKRVKLLPRFDYMKKPSAARKNNRAGSIIGEACVSFLRTQKRANPKRNGQPIRAWPQPFQQALAAVEGMQTDTDQQKKSR